MVVDTSAIIAVLLKEPERFEFLRKLARARSRQISAVSYMESAMVLISRLGAMAEPALDKALHDASIIVTPVSVAHSSLAIAAFRQYGKGRHPASLNFGDCFSYALAKSSDEPLLFKGSDFDKTDLKIA
ncbi:MAG TPA: type II toxin-antitoxin system VapC family toxin [Acidobacteriaceae bacterium]|jgi:ribonuclease VapC|nr:type II toxin-antitoxin system VapC family toxin [Acidobacteriaceae bacterium]